MNVRFFVSVVLAVVVAAAGWSGGSSEAGEGTAGGAAGATAAGPSRFAESPMLAALVAAGELPPVDERLPPEPVVRPVLAEIGTHGGTLFVSAAGQSYLQDMGFWGAAGVPYVGKNPDGSLYPGLLTEWEIADDYQSAVIHVRPGMRWSDGEPVILEDFIFTYEDMCFHPDVPRPRCNPVSGITRLAEWTLRLDLGEPFPALEERMTGGFTRGVWLMPKHYLERWHITYNADADKLADQEGFAGWAQALQSHYSFQPISDFERPWIEPWLMTVKDAEKMVQERNPYYPGVDSAANQLPYLDRIVTTTVDVEGYKLKIIGGEIDLAWLHTNFADFSLYKENERSGDYRVFPVPGLFGAEAALYPNYNHPDPVKRGLVQDERFRIALSVAINREEINEVLFAGQGVARAATIIPSYRWYRDEWETVHAEYDPARANSLLDQLGLTARDGEGYRLRPDGKRMQWTVVKPTERVGAANIEFFEMIKDHWRDVGIRMEIKELETGVYWDMYFEPEPDYDIAGRKLENIPQFSTPGRMESEWAPVWGAWFRAERAIRMGDATLDSYGGTLPGEEPPDWVKEYVSWFEDSRGYPADSPEHGELIRKHMSYNVDHALIIGTVGMVPRLVVAKSNVGNPPIIWPTNSAWGGTLNRWADQVYLKQ